MLLPKDYRKGLDTIEMEYPWIIKSSIDFLETKLTKNMEVLEFGCGGSTFFYAKRCKSVVGFETNKEWYEKIQKFIKLRKIKNVTVHFVKNRYESIPIIAGKKFDVIMVDCDPGAMSRINIMRQVRSVNAKDKCMIVLDNYGYSYCGKSDTILSGYKVNTFNDEPWDGVGTKVYMKGW